MCGIEFTSYEFVFILCAVIASVVMGGYAFYMGGMVSGFYIVKPPEIKSPAPLRTYK